MVNTLLHRAEDWVPVWDEPSHCFHVKVSCALIKSQRVNGTLAKEVKNGLGVVRLSTLSYVYAVHLKIAKSSLTSNSLKREFFVIKEYTFISIWNYKKILIIIGLLKEPNLLFIFNSSCRPTLSTHIQSKYCLHISMWI